MSLKRKTVEEGEFVLGDCLEWMRRQPDDCVDLAFGSPPYEDRRTYGIGFDLKGQVWVDWMVERMVEMVRVTRGLVAMVVGHGKTEGYRWSGVPALLCADLVRWGVCLRSPKWFHRVGICGSGGSDDLRKDVEWIVCATSGGKLPWSDNTAMGHPPKWAPGGEMSHRLSDGTRRNQWGHSGTRQHGARRKDGKRDKAGRSSHTRYTKRKADGKIQERNHVPPAIANPGDLISCKVGGGQMGSALAHETQAPFPERLAEFFVRSFCPPGGCVLDPFVGGGTTPAVAVKTGRRFVGVDMRESQIKLSLRRLREARARKGFGL